MNAQTVRRYVLLALIWAVAGAGIIGLSARGTVEVTRPRLEASLSQTFANLYLQQAKLLGHRGLSISSLDAQAHCDKGGPAVADEGPGADWTCLMTWNDPNVPLPDGSGKFELNVHSNDCFTASGPTRVVGLVTITDTRGNSVPNPVFEFDSCFDPGSSNELSPAPRDSSKLLLPTGEIAPDKHGLIAPDLACSAGAVGGCAGNLTAAVDGQTIGRVIYQLAPGGENTYTFSLPDSGSPTSGSEVTLEATPLIGTVSENPASLSLASR